MCCQCWVQVAQQHLRAALARAAAAEARAAAAEAQAALAAASTAAAAAAPCATCVLQTAGPRMDLSPAAARPPVLRGAACPAAAAGEVTRAAWAGAGAVGCAKADAAVQAVPPKGPSLAAGCPASSSCEQAGRADAAVQVTLHAEPRAAEVTIAGSCREHAAAQAMRPGAPCRASEDNAACALHGQTGPRATTADAAVQAATPAQTEPDKPLQEGLAEGAVRRASGGVCRACGAGRADEQRGMQRVQEPCGAEASRQAEQTPATAEQRPVCRHSAAGRPGAAAAAESSARAAVQRAPAAAAAAGGRDAASRGAAGARPVSGGGPGAAAAAARAAGRAGCAEARGAAGGLQDARACAGGDGGQGCEVQAREGPGRPQPLQHAQRRAPADARASVSILQARMHGHMHTYAIGPTAVYAVHLSGCATQLHQGSLICGCTEPVQHNKCTFMSM